ncbi:hypothetical protein GCM10027269_28600 [Kribbella endophytica]
MPFDGSIEQLRVECGELTLRVPYVNDLDKLMAVFDDDFNLEPQPRPATELVQARQGILTRIERNPHPSGSEWWNLDLIVEAAPGCPIGWASLQPEDKLPGRQLESSSWVAPSYRRKGHATTIRYGLLVLAFDGLDADVAHSRARPDNVGSNTISHNLGYTEGETTYTVPRRTAYANWSLSRRVWEQAARPKNVGVRGHEALRSWLDERRR